MKVLHVIPSVGPLRGGPSFVMRTLARCLAETGMEVHVATTDDNALDRLTVRYETPVREDGATYWYFRRQTRFYICSLPFSRWLKRTVSSFELVHIHALFSYCSQSAAAIAHRQGVPYIVRPLGVLNRWGMQNRRPLLKQLSYRFIEQKIISRAALIHYTSEQERLEAEQLGVKQRSAIIPNPAEPSFANLNDRRAQFRARYPELANKKIVLFLSRIDRKKGLDLLIPAMASVIVSHPDAALVIAGDGDRPLMASLHAEAVRLGIAGSILWTGFLQGSDKTAALADADVFVLPSYSENFGVAVVEPMAAGVPVIVSDQVGIHREIERNQAGVVVPCDAVQLAAAIARLLDSAELRQNMGRRAAQLAQNDFSTAVVTGKLLEAYKSVLSCMA